MKKHLLPPLLCLALPCLGTAAHSDEILGLRFSVSPWLADISGQIQSEVDVEGEVLSGSALSPSQMGLKDSISLAYQFDIRHQLPMLPRLRLVYTPLEAQGSRVLAAEEVFAERTFATGAEVASKLDLSFTDFSFYYTVWDKFTGLDLGMSSRRFAGFARRTEQVSEDPEAPIPAPDDDLSARIELEPTSTLILVQPRLKFPEMPVQLAFSYQTTLGSAVEVKDMEARFSRHWPTEGADYFFEGGYRRLIIDGEIEGLSTRIKVSGPFLALRVAI